MGRGSVTAAVLAHLLVSVYCKIHHLTLKNDGRAHIQLTDFGFLLGGSLEVSLSNLSLSLPVDELDPRGAYDRLSAQVGFSLSRGDEVLEFLRTNPGECLLQAAAGPASPARHAVLFFLDFRQEKLVLRRYGPEMDGLQICRDIRGGQRSCLIDTGSDVTHADVPLSLPGADGDDDDDDDDDKPDATRRTLREIDHMPIVQKVTNLPLHGVGDGDISAKFALRILRPEEEGDYYFIYHNCRNNKWNDKIPANFHVDIIARNKNSFLPAGDIEKPSIYFILAMIFLVSGICWVYVMKAAQRETVYKVHYLMTVLVFLKASSLLFHGINFYFISKHGHQQEGWAVVFYVLHLLKGALLFGVIILIGTGWTFFKGFLSDRDRRLFIIVIPMQVLDNVAMIIIEESEEGQASYRLWMQVFIFIDLMCCAAVILPVIWSIRHLQEGAGTDGKAAFNLGKLRLFRHFYILIIAYIYLTRIIKYLVAFTVPFRWSWLVVLVEETGTWLFFFVTALKFQPTRDNPYLKLSQSDDEEEAEAVTRSGALGDVSRRGRGRGDLAATLDGSSSEEETLLELPARPLRHSAIRQPGPPGPDLG